jgi:hypothetical protein
MSADLLVMRLADMTRHHPDQIIAKCSQCQHDVAVYPSGQKVMRDIPDVRLICHVCREPSPDAQPAPGALEEPFQSVKKQ